MTPSYLKDCSLNGHQLIKNLLFILFVLYFPVNSNANNIQLSNISATTANISFDISWDNSWNLSSAPANWDAAWVIVKFQDCNTNEKIWQHQLLSTVSGNHTASGGLLQVDAVSDGMGVFIRRSDPGSGNLPAHSITLVFASALPYLTNINFEVIAIEMVYVPSGAFFVGDGSTATAPLSQNSMGTNGTSTPREIISEAALAANALSGFNNPAPTQNPAIPDNFPKGFAAFYCMKYEITQGQYVRFLNLLTASQQASRTAVSVTSVAGTLALAPSATPNRNRIEISTPASGNPLAPAVYGLDLNNNGVYNEAGDGAHIACNYLSWYDLLAYLDWAALRPMTELEFEKAARGPSSQGAPVLAAFAWNTTTILGANAGALSNSGTANEVSTSSGNGLCAYNSTVSTHGPLRVGFAATASTGRAGAGASFYGILDLSGNVWEQTYHVGYNAGSGNGAATGFTGVLGNGMVDALGNADPTNWGLFLSSGGGQNGVARSVVRGGQWSQITSVALSADYCKISNRSFVTSGGGENGTRIARTGGRGVRQF